MTRAMMLALVLCASVAQAQVRPTPEGRRDLTPPRDTVRSPLPTIDLPEFVITGLSSVDLPRVEKRLEELGPTGEIVVEPAAPERDRSSGPADVAELGGRPSVGSGEGFAGYLRAGIGSFGSPQVMAAVRPVLGPIRLGASARYRRSTGFAPWTAWSEGAIDGTVAVPLSLDDAGLRNATLSADLGYEAGAYHWYGTPTPDHRRSVTIVDGGIGLAGLIGTWTGALSVRFASAGVEDSTASVTEGTTRLRLSGEGTVEGIPLEAFMSVMSSPPARSFGSSIGSTEFAVRSRYQPIEELWLSGGIGLAFVRGEAGQSRTVLLPSFRVQFAIDEQHRLVGAFEPRVEQITVMSSVSMHRFVDAQTLRQVGHWKNAGRFGLESEWSADLRTRIEVEAGAAADLPMIVDTAGRGVAAWMYGEARTTSLRGEVIAKMRGNDYFSATVIVRTTENVSSGLRIPYWPGLETRMSYSAVVMPPLTVRASVQLVHTRESRWTGPSASLPGYVTVDLGATYALFSELSIWAEASNLTNTVYQHWKGIQEPPFRLSAGIALAW